MVSRNFSKVSLFPEKGVIFPPLISGALLLSLLSSSIFVGFLKVGVTGFLHSNKASKNRSVGVLNLGVVWKLSSMSVCSLVVQGSGVGVLLHRCMKLNDLKGVISGTVGLPTILRDKGFSSESLSSGSRNSPLCHAVLASLSCVQRWSKGSSSELVL